ncbi:hypothetical protein HDE_14395 [Halotydeus destructor]|nr:hypothetical protein HDE_14395 [Halotydeus destructor]
MDAAHVFSTPDKLAATLGAKLFINNLTFTAMAFVSRIACVAATIYWLIYLRITDQHLMMRIRLLSIILFPVASGYLLNTKSARIRNLKSQLLELMSNEQQKKMAQYCSIGLSAYVVGVLAFSSFKIYCQLDMTCSKKFIENGLFWLDRGPRWYDVIAMLARVVDDTLRMKFWVSVVALVYVSILKAWSMANSRFMGMALMKSKLTRTECLSLISMRQRMCVLKMQFNDTMSIFPLLLLSSLFLESSGLIAQLQRLTLQSLPKLAWRTVSYMINLSVITGLVLVAIKVQEAEKDMNEKMLTDSHTKLAEVEDMRLAMKFERVFETQAPISAILFQLNEGLFLAFLGSLVSFTVMFLQMTS